MGAADRDPAKMGSTCGRQADTENKHCAFANYHSNSLESKISIVNYHHIREDTKIILRLKFWFFLADNLATDDSVQELSTFKGIHTKFIFQLLLLCLWSFQNAFAAHQNFDSKLIEETNLQSEKANNEPNCFKKLSQNLLNAFKLSSVFELPISYTSHAPYSLNSRKISWQLRSKDSRIQTDRYTLTVVVSVRYLKGGSRDAANLAVGECHLTSSRGVVASLVV